MTRVPIIALLVVGFVHQSVSLRGLFAADEVLGPSQQQLDESRRKAIEFLRTTQAEDGSWTFPQAVGISALVTYGLIQSGVPLNDPMVEKALQNVASYSQADGRICSDRSQHSGYETSVALMMLKVANESGRYTPIIDKAEAFIRGLQFDEDHGVDQTDDRFGGAGYSPGEGRPDLSNTAFLVEALHAAGASANDPDLQKALIFVSRCQNLESEFNTSAEAATINDGGFFYTVSAGGASPAGKSEEGGLRSYGSMTYAGLKSMIYAGLTPDDPRVEAAVGWIEKHYTVADNPGMGNNGLYYYYQLFAKALDAMSLDHVADPKGTDHDWRKELSEHLFKLQQENGSWVNTSTRWFEGDPNLVSGYALIALSYCGTPIKPQ